MPTEKEIIERLTELLLDREITIETLKQEIKTLKEKKKTIEIG